MLRRQTVVFNFDVDDFTAVPVLKGSAVAMIHTKCIIVQYVRPLVRFARVKKTDIPHVMWKLFYKQMF